MASRVMSFARPSRVQAAWRAVRSAQRLGASTQVQQVRWQSNASGTPGSVSDSSNELVDILKKELSGEQESFEQAPNAPAGWSVKKESTYQFTLEKTDGKFTVSVEVDINNLEEIDTGRMEEPESQEPEAEGGPQYLPNFTVTVANSNATEHARFFCSFDEGAEGDMVFTVNEMCLFKPGTENDVSERKVYHCNAAVLDADMYEGLLKFLEAAGVGPAFLEYLIGQTQSYEQTQYIDFLKRAMDTFKA